MARKDAEKLLAQLDGWELVEDAKKIRKKFKFGDFKEAMKFVNQVAEIAESENHHPDIFVSYNRVEAMIFTHKILGLTESDFILAAKIDKKCREEK